MISNEPKPIINSLHILQLIKTAQQKHGLRHENYQRYRLFSFILFIFFYLEVIVRGGWNGSGNR